ncbi:helix-turn-helix domain-containing protein [Actinomadura sp. 3N508]|uniref:helix-turn-helix domain-containing protein n=1 Tax=Actinomadura sp. 3N508 TaxID=3375153 RepID=UPI0037A9CF6C
MSEPADEFKVDELSAMIRARLERDGLKLREAAAEAGVSAATLSRVINGSLPDTRTFAALVRWLNVSADLFIPQSSTTSVPEVVEAHLRADRTLPPDLAKAIADLVRVTYANHMEGSRSQPSDRKNQEG